MRVISLAPSNTEIIYRLGAQDSLVGTTSLCDYPQEAIDKESVGGWSKGIDTEKVERLEPDLVLGSDDLQDQIVKELEEKGLEVLQVKPHSLNEVYSSIKTIGRALGKDREADKTVEEMKAKLEKLSLDGKRIYCEEWMDPPHFSGNWVPGLIEKINGQYFVEEGQRSSTFDLERLESFDPEHIFLSICGAGEKVSRKSIMEREKWESITAVQNKNVHVVDDSLLNRPGPRLVNAAKTMVRKIN